MIKTDIRELTLVELSSFMIEIGEKKFRATQVWEWLWKKSARSFDEMSNLSLKTRDALKCKYSINPIELSEVQKSEDGTIKSAFITADKKVIEGVLIPTPKRMTACISSQVGCSLTCSFCATGKLKRLRNLSAGEIYDQVVALKNNALDSYAIPLSNIVYMGMGEPLLNYKNVLNSIHFITSEEGLGMSPKRITISTAGIEKMIRKLADDEVRFNLALSLHAADDEKRNKIMPINEQNNIAALIDSLKYFYLKTKNQITFEYIIFKDFNDDDDDAKKLAKLCHHFPVKVNIIEYNPIDDGEFEKADPEKTDAFVEILRKSKVIANVRRSRGKDIDAACGQLANKNEKGALHIRK